MRASACSQPLRQQARRAALHVCCITQHMQVKKARSASACRAARAVAAALVASNCKAAVCTPLQACCWNARVVLLLHVDRYAPALLSAAALLLPSRCLPSDLAEAPMAASNSSAATAPRSSNPLLCRTMADRGFEPLTRARDGSGWEYTWEWSRRGPLVVVVGCGTPYVVFYTQPMPSTRGSAALLLQKGFTLRHSAAGHTAGWCAPGVRHSHAASEPHYAGSWTTPLAFEWHRLDVC